MSRTRAFLTALLTTLLTATAAQAATYSVHSCRTPSGIWVGAAGWSAEAAIPTQERDTGSVAGCTSQNAALGVLFGETRMPVEPSAGRTWSFEAASETTISAIRVKRWFEIGWPVTTGLYGRPYVYDAWHDRDEIANRIEFHYPPRNGNHSSDALEPVLTAAAARWDSVSFRLRCWELMGEDLCGPLRVRLLIPQATIELTDTHVPSGSGSLTDTGPIRGVGRVGFSASDAGGGVYRSILTVDGVEVARSVVDGNGGTCGDVEPGNSDPYEFAVPRPCPLQASGEVAFDTRTLRDGNHALALSVEDAGGNVALVHSAQVVTHNAPLATQAPTLVGDARVGGGLDVSGGQWDGAPTVFEHRWLRCGADGTDCTPIVGAGAARYVPTAADAYRRLVAEVVAGNASGTGATRTAASALIADGSGRTAPPSDEPETPAPRPSDPGPAGPTGPAGPGPATPPIDTGGIGRLENPVAGQGGHAPNGNNASGQARVTAVLRRAGGGSARRVRSPSTRRWTVAGRLTDEHGRPIEGARVNAAIRIVGRRWVAREVVRTVDGGRFTYTLPAGPSRDVRFTYFPFADSRRFRASDTLRIDVFSPLTIKVDRRTVTGMRIVTISGRVSGDRIPAGGLLVTLQGHQRGWGWRTFRTLRTSRRGTWSTQYRFRSSAGRFAFRAIVPRQGSYPFVTTTSRPVAVVVS